MCVEHISRKKFEGLDSEWLDRKHNSNYQTMNDCGRLQTNENYHNNNGDKFVKQSWAQSLLLTWVEFAEKSEQKAQQHVQTVNRKRRLLFIVGAYAIIAPSYVKLTAIVGHVWSLGFKEFFVHWPIGEQTFSDKLQGKTSIIYPEKWWCSFIIIIKHKKITVAYSGCPTWWGTEIK